MGIIVNRCDELQRPKTKTSGFILLAFALGILVISFECQICGGRKLEARPEDIPITVNLDGFKRRVKSSHILR